MAKNIEKKSMGLRRLRQDQWTRNLSSEVMLTHRKLIQPHFVVEGLNQKEAVTALPGVFRETSSTLLKQVESDLENGIHQILLFGVPSNKKAQGFNFDFTAARISDLKKRFGKDLWVSVDVCLCSFTDHGHCGVFDCEGEHLDNAASVEELARAALTYAQAGADCVAPSDMMDGRVGAIREALDVNHLDRKLIMSYSAKFHSRFYGPFRAAADSAPKSGLKDRATYQIEPSCYKDALASSLRDVQEGADILMVKPGLPYLDVLFRLSRKIPKPWVVYEVSGEYASIELMSQQGLISGPEAHLESWTSFFRAGANSIITYGARHGKKWIEGQYK